MNSKESLKSLPLLVNSKKKIKRYKNGIQHGCHATVCMPGCKPIHILQLWLSLELHEGGSGLRLYKDPNLNLSSVGWCLVPRL